MVKRDVVIFGSNGMLGHTLFHYFSQFGDEYNIIGITRKEFNVGEDHISLLCKLIPEKSIVINCIGMIPQKYGVDGSVSKLVNFIHVNGTFPHLLSNIVNNQKNGLFIHISTDCVFNGKKGNYTNCDEPTEKTIYGFSKACGEPKDAMIIRTSIIGEENGKNKTSLLEWVRSNDDMDAQISGFTKHLWNGVCCVELSKIIRFLLNNNITWNGVKQITSNNSISKYELLMEIKDIYNLKMKINPMSTITVDKTLIGNNKELGIEVLPIREQLKEQKDFWKQLKEQKDF